MPLSCAGKVETKDALGTLRVLVKKGSLRTADDAVNSRYSVLSLLRITSRNMKITATNDLQRAVIGTAG